MKSLCLLFILNLSFISFAQGKFDVASVEDFQKELNTQYADKQKSPLTVSDREHFNGLDFYPANEKFFVIANLVRTDSSKPFAMKTSTDRKPLYRKYGELHFTVDGKPMKLNVYQSLDLMKIDEYKDRLFLPYSDLTSGNETYIGGRYIDIIIPSGNTIAVDFNKSYNPYCAYNHVYSCPLIPLENDLPIEIKAGVKKFHD